MKRFGNMTFHQNEFWRKKNFLTTMWLNLRNGTQNSSWRWLQNQQMSLCSTIPKKNILRLFDFDSVQKLIFAWTTDTRSQFQSFQLVTLSWITQKRSRTWFFESRFNFNYYLPTIVENCSVGELKTASEILETDFLSFSLSLISENLHVQRFQKKRKTTKDLLWKQTMCSNLAKLSVTVVVC